MDWLDRMNRALEYIEANLSGQIELEQAARIACCSPFHFQRMFSYIADLPLAEYIRRRRMSRAAADLQAGERVLDVALKYGYNSPPPLTGRSRLCTACRPPRWAAGAPW